MLIKTDHRGINYQDSKYGRGYNLETEIPDRLPLTKQSLKKLPVETPVLVLWEGGNGPYEYILRKNHRFFYVVPRHNPLFGDTYSLVIDFVGAARYNTKVWAL